MIEVVFFIGHVDIMWIAHMYSECCPRVWYFLFLKERREPVISPNNSVMIIIILLLKDIIKICSEFKVHDNKVPDIIDSGVNIIKGK